MGILKSNNRNFLDNETCPACGSTRIILWYSAPDRFLLQEKHYHLHYCTVCSLVWLGNPPPPEEILEHYGDQYHSIVSEGKEGGKEDVSSKWRPAIREIEKYKSGGAILDMGCSSGNFLRSLSKDRWKPHGIEINPATAERARKDAGAEVFTGDVLDAAFPHESFDAITAFDVLEHMYQPVEVLKKVKTWLKPDGIIFLQVPNILSWEARWFGSYWFGLDVPRHLFHFSPRSLVTIGRTLGFEDLSVTTVPISYLEHSFNYVIDGMLRKIGLRRGSMRRKNKPNLCWRSVRKIYRMLALQPFTRAAAHAGRSALVEAVFLNKVRKPASQPEAQASVNS
jgi:2-polyprenyl-3-methyl-5-hydroxy-6-metoxy-1,4-benzoquinol methylase